MSDPVKKKKAPTSKAKVSKTKAKPKAKPAKPPAPPPPVIFLMKRAERFCLVQEEVIDALLPEEAYRLALLNSWELNSQLMQEAQHGPQLINDKNITDELEKTLAKIEQLYPSIRAQILQLNDKIGRC